MARTLAIKGGDLIHVGNQILIDRAQTAGPGQVNIPTDKIYELGNYYSIAQVGDTPDLGFSPESLDLSTSFEALLCGGVTPRFSRGESLDLSESVQMAVAAVQSRPGLAQCL